MNDNEHVFRALNPKKMFESSDGTISPAAFKDKRGLSVEIGMGRSDDEVVNSMMIYLSGNIVKIDVRVCKDVDIEIFNDNATNKYHRLLLDGCRLDKSEFCLTSKQAYYLSKNYEKIIHT